jgi:two-component system, NtrC family, response regulator HydG
MQKVRLLLAEDDERYARRLKKNLEGEHFQVELAPDGRSALERLSRESYDLLLADIRMPVMDGLELLQAVKSGRQAGVDSDLPVILLTSVNSVQTAVEAMQAGAADYLIKDAEWDEIVLHLDRVVEQSRWLRENEALRQQVAAQSPSGEVVGSSRMIQNVLQQAKAAAETEATILITGETGVGKELVARFIHENSPQREGPFMDVNCAALPDDNMFQSELFGHERGAFTGAYDQRKGRFELARGGTLFLDEIGDLSPDSQAKLLRVLESRTFERLGGSRKIQADVRFLLATNRDLNREVAQGRFRQDLYYRVNVLQIQIPPLRQRVEDIQPLAEHFESLFSNRYGRPAMRFSEEALQVLRSHDWPGNVRELKNVLERLSLVHPGGEVRGEDLRACGLDAKQTTEPELVRLPSGGVALEEIEKSAILQALDRSGWVQKEAAELLGISVDRMNARIRKFGLTHPSWKIHR